MKSKKDYSEGLEQVCVFLLCSSNALDSWLMPVDDWHRVGAGDARRSSSIMGGALSGVLGNLYLLIHRTCSLICLHLITCNSITMVEMMLRTLTRQLEYCVMCELPQSTWGVCQQQVFKRWSTNGCALSHFARPRRLKYKYFILQVHASKVMHRILVCK